MIDARESVARPSIDTQFQVQFSFGNWQTWLEGSSVTAPGSQRSQGGDFMKKMSLMCAEAELPGTSFQKNLVTGQDEKPEIRKIKKQATEKRIYNLKDFVVYPKHGVGKIVAVEKANIGEIDIQFYKILVEKEKLTLTVPINQQSKLRPISSINQINKCVSILKTKPKIKRTMWSRRAQEYDQKINSGKIYELAEVVRDLNKGDDLMVDQSYSERQLFEKAYERILSEFQIILNVSLEDTQKKLDKALKRNLGGQTQSSSVAKAPTNELPVDETISDNDEPIDE